MQRYASRVALEAVLHWDMFTDHTVWTDLHSRTAPPGCKTLLTPTIILTPPPPSSPGPPPPPPSLPSLVGHVWVSTALSPATHQPVSPTLTSWSMCLPSQTLPSAVSLTLSSVHRKRGVTRQRVGRNLSSPCALSSLPCAQASS